jgi:hypothetical protein
VFGQHFGVWALVTEVVLYAAPMASAKSALTEPITTFHAAPEMAVQAVLLVDPATCTALVLDRGANSTAMAPCPPTGLALQLERDGARADLAAAGPQPAPAATHQPN